MDEQVQFPCQLVHPGLFPLYRRDPPKLPVMARLAAGAIEFVSTPPGGVAHTLVSERLADIGEVAVQDVSGAAQRSEILRRSLLRMGLIAAVALVAVLLLRPYNLQISLLIAAVAAGTSGLLNFLLNGGLGAKRDIVRFRFAPSAEGTAFGIEVDPAEKQGVWQALQAAGLTIRQQVG